MLLQGTEPLAEALLCLLVADDNQEPSMVKECSRQAVNPAVALHNLVGPAHEEAQTEHDIAKEPSIPPDRVMQEGTAV